VVLDRVPSRQGGLGLPSKCQLSIPGLAALDLLCIVRVLVVILKRPLCEGFIRQNPIFQRFLVFDMTQGDFDTGPGPSTNSRTVVRRPFAKSFRRGCDTAYMYSRLSGTH